MLPPGRADLEMSGSAEARAGSAAADRYLVFLGNGAGRPRPLDPYWPGHRDRDGAVAATFRLALTAFVLAVVVARCRSISRHPDLGQPAMLFALIGQSAPTFYIGIMLILVMGDFNSAGSGLGRGQGSWLNPRTGQRC
jgi:hypothetical protein